jgi:hypothetical protein
MYSKRDEAELVDSADGGRQVTAGQGLGSVKRMPRVDLAADRGHRIDQSSRSCWASSSSSETGINEKSRFYMGICQSSRERRHRLSWAVSNIRPSAWSRFSICSVSFAPS